ncbi:MAG TPA: hypothetical protein VIL44_05155 [Micromonospora sp.]
MSTNVDISPAPAAASPRPRRLIWVAVILAVTVLGVLVVYHLTRSPDKPADLRSQITTYLVAALEQSPPNYHDHGDHPGATEEARTLCATRVFGFEPTDATQLADVRTVYGHHFCVMAKKGIPWEGAPKLVGPFVADLTVNPPRVEVAAPTESQTFAERVQQLIPEPYRAQAFEESLEPTAMEELRRRYDEAVR